MIPDPVATEEDSTKAERTRQFYSTTCPSVRPTEEDVLKPESRPPPPVDKHPPKHSAGLRSRELPFETPVCSLGERFACRASAFASLRAGLILDEISALWVPWEPRNPLARRVKNELSKQRDESLLS